MNAQSQTNTTLPFVLIVKNNKHFTYLDSVRLWSDETETTLYVASM